MVVLVSGATGSVGRLVVERLIAAGEQIRALTRDPEHARSILPAEVDVVRGDLAEPESVAAAADGADRMYLFPVAATAREVVGAARKAGVRKVVVLSSGAVTGGYDTDFHLPVERAVEESGLAWTHVRPGEFMLNKLWLWGPSVRSGGVVHETYPDVAWCPVHEADIADVAAAALLEDGHDGKFYDLNGPALITCREQVAAIAEATGRDIRLDVVSPADLKEIYVRQGGFAADNADFLVGFEDYSGNAADPDTVEAFDLASAGPLPTAEAVTVRPARTFAQWAQDRAADFR